MGEDALIRGRKVTHHDWHGKLHLWQEANTRHHLEHTLHMSKHGDGSMVRLGNFFFSAGTEKLWPAVVSDLLVVIARDIFTYVAMYGPNIIKPLHAKIIWMWKILNVAAGQNVLFLKRHRYIGWTKAATGSVPKVSAQILLFTEHKLELNIFIFWSFCRITTPSIQ